MPSLRELQRDVRAALLGDDARAAREVVADGLAPEARLAVYRHHVLTSLTAALEATFPVVVRLVDPRFFRFACDRYVRAEPTASRSPRTRCARARPARWRRRISRSIHRSRCWSRRGRSTPCGAPTRASATASS